MNVDFLPNGIPHDAIVLTNSNSLEDFMSSKALAIPFSSTNVYPWEVEVHLTGFCGLSCKGCSYSKRHLNDSLSIQDLIRIFFSIKNMGSHTLFFSGGGDPLCWNKWDDLVRIKSEIIPEVVTGISTNLIANIDCGFINDFFDIVQVHIVGFDDNSCKSNTNTNCFEILNKQLSLLKNDNLVLKILINSTNYNLIDNYLTYVCKFNAKTVVLKFEQDFLFNRQTIDSELFEKIKEIVSNHHDISKYKYVFYSKTDKKLLKMPSKCHIVDKHLYCLIRENGDVYPCIASAYSNKNSIGNIHCESLEEIYTRNIDSTKYSTNMKKKECPLFACRHFRFNQELEYGIFNSSSFLNYIPSLL